MLSRHARTLYLGLAFSVAPLTTSTQNERTGVAVLTHWLQPRPLGTGGG